MLGFKEALLEEAEKKKDTRKYVCLHSARNGKMFTIFTHTKMFFYFFRFSFALFVADAIFRSWKVIVLRIFVNFLVLCLLVVSASAVVFVVNR